MDTDPMVSRPEIGMQTQLLYHKGCVSIRHYAKNLPVPYAFASASLFHVYSGGKVYLFFVCKADL